MINVVLYRRENSEACDRVLTELEEIQKQIPHRLIVIDIDKDEHLRNAYSTDVPLVQVGPFSLKGEISRDRLLIALGATQDRTNHLMRIGTSNKNRNEEVSELTKMERFSFWMSRNYLWVINIFLLVFLGGAFLAPVLMKAGAEYAGRTLYALYSPFCHQLAFRSWFLFGEQAYYPRELAQIPDAVTYEELAGSGDLDLFSARDLIGDHEHGYKVALCQRDIAIFASMLFFGVIYGLLGRRVRPIRWYILLIFGLLPLLIDGGSQLKGVLVNELPDWLPLRESTPLFRTITGILFGVLTAWYVLPYIEDSAKMTQRMLARKKIIAKELMRESKQ